MKRLIFLGILAAAVAFTSCDSPMELTPKTDSGNMATGDLPAVQWAGDQLVKPDSVRHVAWNQFQTQHGKSWKIRWNKHTGLPVSVFAGVTRAFSGNPEQAARSFLAEHSTLFGFANLKDLKYVGTQVNRGIRHVTFNQTIDGVPVYEGQYKVHLRADGRVDMANGHYYPGTDISTTPSVSKTQAVRTARNDLDLTSDPNLETAADLMIYPGEKHMHLAWKIILFKEQPVLDQFYMVDAQSGEVLTKQNRLTDVTGDGDIYPKNPNLSSVTNKSLYRLNGNGYLQGTYAYILNDDGDEAYSSSNSFQYSPSNTHFDEANLYYHIDRFRHDFIDNLISGSFGFTQIKAHSHAYDAYLGDANAWFSPSSRELYFGDAASSSTYNDFAKEDKVVQHEYGHAVIYEIQSGISSSNDEEGAISEGTPDYWAGSFTGRSVIGDYVGATRDMASPDISSYSGLSTDPNTGEVNEEAHDGGEFFSAILWDLRGQMSSSDVDFLVYDALYRVTGDPDFLEFRDAMMAADDAAYGGANNNTIQDAFYFRDVGTYSLSSYITGLAFVRVGDSPIWSVTISGGQSPYAVTWYKRDTPNDSWLGVGTGGTYQETISSRSSFQLRTCVTDGESITRCSAPFQVDVR